MNIQVIQDAGSYDRRMLLLHRRGKRHCSAVITLFSGVSWAARICQRGSMGALVRSVKERILVLPDETRVYPGHMEETTVGYEKKYNPFL